MQTDSSNSKVVLGVVLSVLGAVAMHLWTRYRRRLAVLRWSAQHQPMAFATHDFGWGKVDILYNDQPILNLHITRVQLQNASSKDLESVEVRIALDQASGVLRSAASLRGSTDAFPFATNYAEAVAKSHDGTLTPDEIAHWTRRSDFQIPVLNRGAIADFTLFVSREDYATPEVSVECNHLGTRLLPRPLAQEVFGVRLGQAQVAGLVTGVIVLAFLYLSPLPWLVVVAISWMLGLMGLSVGAGVVRIFRWLGRMAD